MLTGKETKEKTVGSGRRGIGFKMWKRLAEGDVIQFEQRQQQEPDGDVYYLGSLFQDNLTWAYRHREKLKCGGHDLGIYDQHETPKFNVENLLRCEEKRKRPKTQQCGSHDLGIYDYKEGSFSSCYYPIDLDKIQRILPAPIWFTPDPDVDVDAECLA
ncbi:hypothetical protein MTR67_015006 [Solanum verrucosum]|uniref:Uncharacterized protein n=1 Tax=Solanum verrucosum TaxID=315347 RepID=A0AAF0TJH0_SOLVR|nr:hypothetical protein MTR67_015006 [Solanum verrucosum]